MSDVSRGAWSALSAALDREGLGLGDVPDPAHEAVEDALGRDETALALAEAVAGLDSAEGLLGDEVRAVRREEAPDGEPRLADRDVVHPHLRSLDSDTLGVLDDAVDLLDRRVVGVARDAVRVERHGHSVDLRHAVMRDCPVCEAGEESHQTGREWFAHLGSTTPGEGLVDGWLCLGCGSVVHERTGEGGRVEEARVVETPAGSPDLSTDDLDVSEAWDGEDSDVDRGEGVRTDGGVPVETCAATGCDRQATGQLFAEFDGCEFEVPTCDAHPPEVRTDGGRDVEDGDEFTMPDGSRWEVTTVEDDEGMVRVRRLDDGRRGPNDRDSWPVEEVEAALADEDLRTDGGHREPGREEVEAGVDRDPVVCEAVGCDEDEDLTATPGGALCRRHADELAESLRTDGGVDECPSCGETARFYATDAPGAFWCESCEREFWREASRWYSCDVSGDATLVTDGGRDVGDSVTWRDVERLIGDLKADGYEPTALRGVPSHAASQKQLYVDLSRVETDGGRDDVCPNCGSGERRERRVERRDEVVVECAECNYSLDVLDEDLRTDGGVEVPEDGTPIRCQACGFLSEVEDGDCRNCGVGPDAYRTPEDSARRFRALADTLTDGGGEVEGYANLADLGADVLLASQLTAPGDRVRAAVDDLVGERLMRFGDGGHVLGVPGGEDVSVADVSALTVGPDGTVVAVVGPEETRTLGVLDAHLLALSREDVVDTFGADPVEVLGHSVVQVVEDATESTLLHPRGGETTSVVSYYCASCDTLSPFVSTWSSRTCAAVDAEEVSES